MAKHFILKASIFFALVLLVMPFFAACGGTVNNITLSFMVDGSVYQKVEATDTTSITMPDDPIKDDYTFDGWYWDNGTWQQPFTANSLLDIPFSSDIYVYAKLTPIVYTITYQSDDGIYQNPNSYTVEDTVSLSNATKDGYVFDGWYNGETRVTEIAAGSKGNLTLTAHWSLATYQITYTNTKWAENKNPATYTIENETIILSDISADGYTFEGWYNGDIKVTEISKGSYGDLVLTAKWSANSYPITYLNLDGAVHSNPTTYNIDSETIALQDASKMGYLFLGWYTAPEGGEKVTEIPTGSMGDKTFYARFEEITYNATFKADEKIVAVIPFTISTTSITSPALEDREGYTKAWEPYELQTADIIINAVYTPIVYTITYNNIKGATNNNVTTYTIESEKITLSGLTVTGYTFNGWYNGDKKVTEIPMGSTGDLTLTAKWTPIAYSLTLLWDENFGRYADGVSNPATYTIEDTVVLNPLYNYTYGYGFAGWYTKKNEGEGTLVKSIPQGSIGDRTYYAHWTLVNCTITYHNTKGAINTNATTYTVESETFDIFPLSLKGYTFAGWYQDEATTVPATTRIVKGSFGNLDLYAKWMPISYGITYVLYGGSYSGNSNPATYTIEDKLSFVQPTLSGYMFVGWFTQAEGGSKVTGIDTGTTGNQTFYARWIKFNSNGGSAITGIEISQNTILTTPVTPEKEYYTFAGWYKDEALTQAYSLNSLPSTNVTLYAKWTPTEYTITYVLNGGTNAKNNPAKYTVESNVIFAAPTKTGYTFVGWFTDADFTSAVVEKIEAGTHGAITLYANYATNQYTVTFETNGGTSVEPIKQNYGTTLTAPESPAKNGYTFGGWYSDASLKNAYTFTTVPAQDITLYAKWDTATYRITYQLNGGTNASANPATYTITSDTITLQNPTKKGCTFLGWFSDSALTKQVTQIVKGSYGNRELFAKWEATIYSVTYHGVTESEHTNPATYTVDTDFINLVDAVRAGYHFDGWYSTSNYTALVTTIAGGSTENIHLYAKFTANTYYVWLNGTETPSYTVSFDLNGAEGTVPSQTITETTKLKYPDIPTRDGFVFAGWYEDEACTGRVYDFAALITSDVTLYAKWVSVGENTGSAVGKEHSFELKGTEEKRFLFVPLVSGNVTLATVGNSDTFGRLYDADNQILFENDDTGSDKNFQIIYNVTAGKTYIIAVRGFGSEVSGNTTLRISASATTPADGGYAVVGNRVEVTFGEAFKLPVPTVGEGYKFLGWQTTDGTLLTDSEGNGVAAWNIAKDTLLTSKCERMTYTVTFDTQGGSEVNPVTLAFGDRLDLNLYHTTLAGKSFLGWYLSLSDSAPYNATTMPDENITLYARWTTFGLGKVKYNTDKKAISVHDTITPELFGIICLDTNNNYAAIALDEVEGTFAAGETLTLYFTATSGGKSKPLTITGVKVYGDPTIKYNNTVDYFSIGKLTASHFGASGKDTYGNATTIQFRTEKEYKAGDIVTLYIDSVDAAGNVTTATLTNIKVYGKPVITYREEKLAISVSDTLSAELFQATAKDSFGEVLSVSVTRYSGTILAGNTVTIRISATDSKRNVTNIDRSVKVYGVPAISNATTTDFKVTDSITPESLGLTAKDTYGENLTITLSVKSGKQTAGEILVLTASATDVAGNTTTKNISVKIYGEPKITYDRTGLKVGEDAATPSIKVTFDLNGGSGEIPAQTVTDTVGLIYPDIPVRDGYVFAGWTTTKDGNAFFDFSKTVEQDTTVYAKWEAMVTSGFYQREIIDIRSSTAYSFDTSGTTDLEPRYTYFTALTSGTYYMYYKNGSSSSSNGTYVMIYNVTKGTTIKSNVNCYSTSYSRVSISADMGDVIYVRTYGDNNYYSTFSFHITGAETPAAGGKADIYGASVLNAAALDSFGTPLTVKVALKAGTRTKGNKVVYTLKATDHLGNVATLDTAALGVYDAADIQLTYKALSSAVKLSSQGEEFEASATDTFGNACAISFRTAKGYTLAGGNTVTLYIVAIDAAGNEKCSDPISNIKVYDLPTLIFDQYLCTDTNIRRFASAVDSFGEEVAVTITASGPLTEGEWVTITVKATDELGNVATIIREYRVNAAGISKGLAFTSNNDGTCSVSGIGTCTDTVVRIPYHSLAGDLVTGIAERAFYDEALTSITIPDSVTSIGEYAFYGCKSLTSVTIGNSVTSIGISAFFGCTSLTSVYITDLAKWCAISFGYYDANPLYYARNLYLNGKLVTDLVIPDSVTSIGSRAFSDCSGLTSITIPDSVTSIGKYAFQNCTSLTSITIPDSVTSIGSGAFSDCTSLTSITIPDSVTSIGSGAFSGTSLRYNVYDNAKYLGNANNPYVVLIKATDTSIAACEIHPETKVIYYNAFYACKYLRNITIPDSVTNIGQSVFYCDSSCLMSVYITDLAAWCNILFDGYYANPLYYAQNLYLNGELVTDLVIPDGVTSIGAYAFYKCKFLTSVTIGNSVTSIGDYAFYDCYGLTSITIPSSVTSIGERAFSGCSRLTSITIPDSVTSIGEYAFSGCTSLTSITIPDSVTSIGEYAFSNCKSLTSVTIGNSVTSIGEYAFSACKSLTSVTIGNSVTSIGISAFSGCNALTSVYITDLAKWCTISFEYGANPLYYAHNLYLNGKLVTDLVIPDSVTSIGYDAFSNCKSLTSVTIGNNVTSIGYGAFSACTSLTNVTIGNSVTSIGEYAFQNCTSLTSVAIGNSVTSIGKYAFEGCYGLTSVAIGNSVTSIGEYAFNRCFKLTIITIPNSVTSIGYGAFNGCTSLQYNVYDNAKYLDIAENPYVVLIEPTDTSITACEIHPETKVIYNNAFSDCKNLRNITIPDSVTSIGNGAFYGCNSLTSVTIPDSVTNIGTSAFYGCTSLTSVTIPDSVTNIGTSAFYGCTSLTSITIPDSVTSIGYRAFQGCTALTSVYITDLAKWCAISFDDYDANPLYYARNLYLNGKLVTDLVIPDSVTSIGKYAFYNCSNLTSVTFANTSRWYRTNTQGASSGTNMTVTNPSTNATNLRTYYDYYWYRK